MTSNKNVHIFWNNLLAQLIIPFHMVWSTLCGASVLKSAQIEAYDWPIKNSVSLSVVSETLEQNGSLIWKGLTNYASKWCQKLCTFLFEATLPLERCVIKCTSVSYPINIGVFWWLVIQFRNNLKLPAQFKSIITTTLIFLFHQYCHSSHCHAMSYFSKGTSEV